ncbi:MAG: hypothetical protein Q7S95_00405 [bacterium]|nr:hypothetical protein [bacterium]
MNAIRRHCGLVAVLFFSLAVAACGDSERTEVGPDHIITVDGTKTLGQMVDAGHYDSINRSINATNFPIENKGKRDKVMVLVSFNRDVSSENAVDEMKARNLRPAVLDECLAYGAAIAKVYQDYGLGAPTGWIACLGQSTVVDGGRFVPELWRDVFSNGMLRLDLWFGVWPSGSHFLAVRN